jgi:hypothetical protein
VVERRRPVLMVEAKLAAESPSKCCGISRSGILDVMPARFSCAEREIE